jgi:hypothetical protein
MLVFVASTPLVGNRRFQGQCVIAVLVKPEPSAFSLWKILQISAPSFAAALITFPEEQPGRYNTLGWLHKYEISGFKHGPTMKFTPDIRKCAVVGASMIEP